MKPILYVKSSPRHNNPRVTNEVVWLFYLGECLIRHIQFIVLDVPTLTPAVLSRGQALASNGGVKTISYQTEMVHGQVEGTGTLHYPEIHFDGRMYCGCRGYVYHDKPCAHLIALVESVPSNQTRDTLKRVIADDETNYTNTTMSLQDNIIETDLDAFNDMMALEGTGITGGLPMKTGIGIAGRPKAGKTILSFQMAMDAMSNTGKNALILDTEGNIMTYYGWIEVFQNRFGIDVSLIEVDCFVDGADVQFDYSHDPDAEHQLFVLDVRELQDILAIHGRPAAVSTADGKMALEPNGEHVNVWESPIGKLIANNDIVFQAYDSISNPLESFTNRQQDRPTRAKATQWWLLQAQALADDLDLCQVYVTHLTKNPANQWDRPDTVGGKALKHQTSFFIYLRQSDKEEREMKLFRHPNKQEWVDEWNIDIESGKGFVDQ